MLLHRTGFVLALFASLPLAQHGMSGSPAFDGGPLAASSGVWHVDDDGGPGVDFTDVQPAIDSARPGDVILVGSGDYSRVRIEAKAITIRAEAGAEVRIHESTDSFRYAVAIQSTASDQPVTLQGLTLVVQNHRGFLALACEGTVWIEDCEVARPNYATDMQSGEGMCATDCDSIVLIRSTLLGARAGKDTFSDGGDGLIVRRSTVHAFGSTFRAGSGADTYTASGTTTAGDGGSGLVVDPSDSFVLATGCTIEGGSGGWCAVDLGSACTAGAGGHAAHLGNGTEVWFMDWVAVAGNAGAVTEPDGELLHLEGNAIALGLPAQYLSAEATPIVPAGDDIIIDFSGPASVPVFFSVSDVPDPFAIYDDMGTSLLGPPVTLHSMGITSPAGVLQASLPTPPIGPWPGHLLLYTQAHYVDPWFGLVLGEGSTVLLLDS